MFDKLFSMPIKEAEFNAFCGEYPNEDEAYLNYMLAENAEKSLNVSKAA